MTRDFNHVILTGEAMTAPKQVLLRSGKPIALFTLKNLEKFVLGSGKMATHENFLSIEVFGRNVERTLVDVRQGDRYVITGYLRVDEVDGIEKVRVRAFNIQEE